MTTDEHPLAFVAQAVQQAGLRACLIGGHAVNAWIEARFTADIDLTVLADKAGLDRLQQRLVARGYRLVSEVNAELPSGPDFVRYAGRDGDPPIDVQAAKTSLQMDVVARAIPSDAGLAIATPEDLIVLKLIAHRPKDLGDLRGLVALPSLDWPYIERWVHEWQLDDRLARLRTEP